MDRGVFIPRKDAEKTTLSDALDRYLREVTIYKKNQRSEKIYVETWKKAFGLRSMASIFQSDIAKYRNERLKVVSPNMVRLELALLSHLFTIGVKEWGMAGLVNPVMQIRNPKLPRGRDRRLLPGSWTGSFLGGNLPSWPNSSCSRSKPGCVGRNWPGWPGTRRT